MLISSLCSPLFVLKRGVLGSLYIVFVKVIIWVNSLVQCWAGGRHYFHLKELALVVVIKFWGVGGVFVLIYVLSLKFCYRLKLQYNEMLSKFIYCFFVVVKYYD